MSTLLVVDDEQSICWGLTRLGESIGHRVITASSAEQALEIVEKVTPAAIILDVRLPGMDGLTAINALRQRVGRAPIIVITAYGDLETAVSAVRNGAFEYLLKPFDLDQVQAAIERALAEPPINVEAPPDVLASGLVGSSPPMQEVFKRIALAAASDANVLLSGESGCGKELAARAIYTFSNRSDRPFVAVNIAALSPSLAESELFGHARGAFTGADGPRQGLLPQADGGTLFLDEVADIPLPTQVKLLRALDHGEVVPVGANRAVPASFRVISATHQDLVALVQKGQFRLDLYFRLCGFTIQMPSLRDRPEDLPALARHFCSMLASRAGSPTPAISEGFLEELRRRPWYGNVRELRKAIEHATVLARGGTLTEDHLPLALAPMGNVEPENNEQRLASLVRSWTNSQLSGAADPVDLHERLMRLVEPPLLAETLAQSGGRHLTAARKLGLHRTTVKRKSDEYGLQSTDD